ncbi:MAG: hypothetical protein H6825_11025 [Planctomycetes bacterium]|nr:hypothetical protein [Planctomycetota bacterium]
MTRPARLLRDLEALKDSFGTGRAEQKLAALLPLERVALPDAGQVRRLHEILCFWRAYPESPELLECVERMLDEFERRADLRRHRRALDDSGIAGTRLHFPFFWLMALRLAERWPGSIHIDWDAFTTHARLADMLHLLTPFTETLGTDSAGLSTREWLQLLKGPDETDAAFLCRRFESMPVPQATREFLFEGLDVPFRVEPGETTPARTRERWPAGSFVLQRRPLDTRRPDLRAAVRGARMRVRSVSPAQGRELVELANALMVARHRDLLVFLHGDEHDVRIVDFGDGLQFACIGAAPERRFVLESVYGFITIKNRVPIGYVLSNSLFGSSEIAYNVFDTFRGGEAATIYGRVLAMVHRLFGADCFAVDPYQMGHHNHEGQQSGAWWFYYKLGFRPRDPEVRTLVREELARMERDRGYRTSPARIHRLAAAPMFFSLGRSRPDVVGALPLEQVGLRISAMLAERFGADREEGIRVCASESARLLGMRLSRLSPGERVAWDRWGPLVLTLPGVARWTAAQRRGLAAVIRAKGGRRESDFVRLFDRHARLRGAIRDLAR